MANITTIYRHLTVGKIFQLEDLEIPPKDYATFLTEAVEGFKQLILQHGEVQTLDELGEKWAKGLREANPESNPNDFSNFNPAPISIGFGAQLRFLKPESSDRVPFQAYQSREHFEDFFKPYLGGTRISLEEYQKQLTHAVDTINKELNKRYEERQRHLFSNLFRTEEDKTGKNSDIYQFLAGFRFTLHLVSVQSGLLETDVTLRDYGVASKGDGLESMALVPAVSIRAVTLGGSLEFPQTVVDTLGDLVKKFYPINDVEHRQSYVASGLFKQKED